MPRSTPILKLHLARIDSPVDYEPADSRYTAI